MSFPETRLRRLRRTPSISRMVSMPVPGPEKFIWPVFLVSGSDIEEPLHSLPGQHRYSPDALIVALEPVVAQGVGGILLFGSCPDIKKDAKATFAFSKENPVLQAIPLIRGAYPELTIFTDVCICPYTEQGLCGIPGEDGNVDNDLTLPILAKMALAHAEAGAHSVAPSAMMDGQVSAIRLELDRNSMQDTLIMSYSSKFCSAMYGPFRDALSSTPVEGGRHDCQVSPSDPASALRESQLDEEEGADILMVKPVIFYLDILAELRRQTLLPVAAYNVSGEYAMLNALAESGGGNLREMVRESITAMSRAGADIIIAYWASRYDELVK